MEATPRSLSHRPSTTASPPAVKVFATTHWTQVVAARGSSTQARQALSDLCAAYYEPVVAYLRHGGRNDDTARELAHQFFERVLDGRSFEAAAPGGGRFRSYLLGAVKHFLAETHRNARAAKRGGGQCSVSLDSAADQETSAELQIPDPAGPVPDARFDRHWAVTVVDLAAAGLAAEYAARGQAAQFAALKPWLLGDVPTLSRAEAAAELGLSEGALKVSIHRLRKCFS
jgi:DNA-directed RNA polymerase specialized sigma24 family protein